MNKTIGILGGMGTFATLKFLQYLTELSEPDEFRFILDNAVHILERTKAVKEDREDEVEKGIINSFLDMRNAPIDFWVAPCNQVHYWHKRVDGVTSVPWLNMIEIVSDAVTKGGYSSPLVLGGYVTVTKKLYSEYLPGAVYPSAEQQKVVVKTIKRLKNDDPRFNDIRKIEGIIKDGRLKEHDCVILACTELPTLEMQCYDTWESINAYPYDLIDSSLELAKAAIAYARSA